MTRYHRRTAPKVRDGKVQKKNRTAQSPWIGSDVLIDRMETGPGYRHVLRKRDVERFLALLPDWAELSRGLDTIILAPGEVSLYGWHRAGRVAVCAWSRGLVEEWSRWWTDKHMVALERLAVDVELIARKRVRIHWTEAGIRGFQLMVVLLHELGHHHDRMSTRSRSRAARGEPYAIGYAERYADTIWDAYLAEFGF